MSLSPAWLPKNENGGYYAPGKANDFDTYCQLAEETFPLKPSTRMLAKEARIGQTYTLKIIKEIEEYGGVLDPVDVKAAKKSKQQKSGIGCRSLTPVHEAFLSFWKQMRCAPILLGSTGEFGSCENIIALM